ncbi:hypothetical protein MKZ38_009365 [Zalerion maritima]|uniref:Uncharacterized protein n=1 Tax=Zalerion maritima TaxID=339359 RepID=A0AAD5WVS2_9PEZI|nr:hypothetical protein MKZ38_009365 [Zalerion maritima]
MVSHEKGKGKAGVDDKQKKSEEEEEETVEEPLDPFKTFRPGYWWDLSSILPTHESKPLQPLDKKELTDAYCFATDQFDDNVIGSAPKVITTQDDSDEISKKISDWAAQLEQMLRDFKSLVTFMKNRGTTWRILEALWQRRSPSEREQIIRYAWKMEFGDDSEMAPEHDHPTQYFLGNYDKKRNRRPRIPPRPAVGAVPQPRAQTRGKRTLTSKQQAAKAAADKEGQSRETARKTRERYQTLVASSWEGQPGFKRNHEPICQEWFIWPHLNLETLVEGSSLLELINEFAREDLDEHEIITVRSRTREPRYLASIARGLAMGTLPQFYQSDKICRSGDGPYPDDIWCKMRIGDTQEISLTRYYYSLKCQVGTLNFLINCFYILSWLALVDTPSGIPPTFSTQELNNMYRRFFHEDIQQHVFKRPILPGQTLPVLSKHEALRPHGAKSLKRLRVSSDEKLRKAKRARITELHNRYAVKSKAASVCDSAEGRLFGDAAMFGSPQQPPQEPDHDIVRSAMFYKHWHERHLHRFLRELKGEIRDMTGSPETFRRGVLQFLFVPATTFPKDDEKALAKVKASQWRAAVDMYVGFNMSRFEVWAAVERAVSFLADKKAWDKSNPWPSGHDAENETAILEARFARWRRSQDWANGLRAVLYTGLLEYRNQFLAIWSKWKLSDQPQLPEVPHEAAEDAPKKHEFFLKMSEIVNDDVLLPAFGFNDWFIHLAEFAEEARLEAIFNGLEKDLPDAPEDVVDEVPDEIACKYDFAEKYLGPVLVGLLKEAWVLASMAKGLDECGQTGSVVADHANIQRSFRDGNVTEAWTGYFPAWKFRDLTLECWSIRIMSDWRIPSKILYDDHFVRLGASFQYPSQLTAQGAALKHRITVDKKFQAFWKVAYRSIDAHYVACRKRDWPSEAHRCMGQESQCLNAAKEDTVVNVEEFYNDVEEMAKDAHRYHSLQRWIPLCRNEDPWMFKWRLFKQEEWFKNWGLTPTKLPPPLIDYNPDPTAAIIDPHAGLLERMHQQRQHTLQRNRAELAKVDPASAVPFGDLDHRLRYYQPDVTDTKRKFKGRKKSAIEQRDSDNDESDGEAEGDGDDGTIVAMSLNAENYALAQTLFENRRGQVMTLTEFHSFMRLIGIPMYRQGNGSAVVFRPDANCPVRAQSDALRNQAILNIHMAHSGKFLPYQCRNIGKNKLGKKYKLSMENFKLEGHEEEKKREENLEDDGAGNDEEVEGKNEEMGERTETENETEAGNGDP